jgi:hypothetical protein
MVHNLLFILRNQLMINGSFYVPILDVDLQIFKLINTY